MIRSFNGKTPNVPVSTFVSEAAYVVGDVELGENAAVWPCAVIRADSAKIKIGSNSHIEDCSVVHSGHPMEIGDNVIIGHGVVIHCKRIGNNTLIGNSATILSDVEIGDFCIIGAGCVVEEREKIPSRSFVVGVPGRIRKKVTEEQLKYIEDGIKTYSDRAKQFKKEGL
jgi:carbonic anhydrase/acetyltransferase-like protein (isoleucine patch superfamily)